MFTLQDVIFQGTSAEVSRPVTSGAEAQVFGGYVATLKRRTT